jgi:hypothetical protein
MSEHISWATCPHCGQPAAVGWVSTVAADGEPTGEIAVEFDCVADCQLSAAQVALAFGAPCDPAGPHRDAEDLAEAAGVDRAAEHGIPRHREAQGHQRPAAAARRRRPAAAMDERLTERAPGSTVPPPTAAR